jgi:hypothetical protein
MRKRIEGLANDIYTLLYGFNRAYHTTYDALAHRAPFGAMKIFKG